MVKSAAIAALLPMLPLLFLLLLPALFLNCGCNRCHRWMQSGCHLVRPFLVTLILLFAVAVTLLSLPTALHTAVVAAAVATAV